MILLLSGMGLSLWPLRNGNKCKPILQLRNPKYLDGKIVEINGIVLPGEGCPIITNIEWDWGDGIQEDSWFPAKHEYAMGGTYKVKVLAKDQDGNSAKAEKSVSVSSQ